MKIHTSLRSLKVQKPTRYYQPIPTRWLQHCNTATLQHQVLKRLKRLKRWHGLPSGYLFLLCRTQPPANIAPLPAGNHNARCKEMGFDTNGGTPKWIVCNWKILLKFDELLVLCYCFPCCFKHMGNPLRFRISAFVSPLSANFSAKIWLLLARRGNANSKSCIAENDTVSSFWPHFAVVS